MEQGNEDKLAVMVYLLAYFALPVCSKSLGSGEARVAVVGLSGVQEKALISICQSSLN